MSAHEGTMGHAIKALDGSCTVCNQKRQQRDEAHVATYLALRAKVQQLGTQLEHANQEQLSAAMKACDARDNYQAASEELRVHVMPRSVPMV